MTNYKLGIRTLNPDWIGISFSEYLRVKEENLNPIVKKILNNHNQKEEPYLQHIDYLIDTCQNFKTKIEEIKDLLKQCNHIIIDSKDDIDTVYRTYVIPILIIVVSGEFEQDYYTEIDNSLHRSFTEYFKKLFDSDKSFNEKISQFKYWKTEQYFFQRELGIGLITGDSTYIKNLMIKYNLEFETFKSLFPVEYVDFINLFKIHYKSDPKDYKTKNSDFYRQKCLEQIIICKNIGIYENYYELLEDYYTEKLKTRPRLNWVFKNFLGYGEKPWLLAFLFLGINLLFALLFTWGNFDFNSPSGVTNDFERLISFIYFNNTTMLTIGYGDIYPTGIGAKIVVFILQLSGFILSSGALALFLRRILRF